MAYRIDLYDVTGSTWTRTDSLRNATRIRLVRGIEGTESITFRIPRDDEQLPSVRLGTFLRVHDDVRGVDLAAGQVRGSIAMEGTNLVEIEARGLAELLDDAVFPPEYVLSGTLSSSLVRARLTQRYDWRRITAKAPAGVTVDNDEIVCWDGNPSGGTNEQAAYSNTFAWDVHDSTDEDSAGLLQILGTDQNGDGIAWEAPYSTSGTYTSPFLDFGSAPTAYDTLRALSSFIGSEIRYRAATFSSLAATRSFSGLATTLSDDLSGNDLSSLTPQRYIAIELTFAPTNTDEGPPPWIQSLEVIARRAIDGITAGTFPSIDLDDLDVGGRTLRSVLDEIAETYDLEWRVTTTGTVEMQSRPTVGTVGTVWGTDRRATYHLVEGWHCDILRYAVDDSELVNYLVVYGTGDGLNASCVVVQDATSQSTYGVRASVRYLNRQRLSDLQADAQTILANYKDPRTSMRIRILRTPDDTTAFEPGDLIRVSSQVTRAHDGSTIDESLRIVREIREWTDAGETIELELERGPRRLTTTIAREMRKTRRLAAYALSRIEEGTITTDTISDALTHEYTVLFDFEPEWPVNAYVERVYDAGAGRWYDALSSPLDVRIVSKRIGTRRATFGVKLVSGSGSYVAQIRWIASGRMRKVGGLG